MTPEPYPRAVAFLQNMWVRDPVRARAALAEHGVRWWRRATYQFLFGGCITGRRLKAAFGTLIDRIVWEEATLEIAGDAKKVCAPQPEHIRAVLEDERPAVVLAFGKVAGDAVSALWNGKLIRAPHPAARQADVPARLNDAAKALRDFLQ